MATGVIPYNSDYVVETGVSEGWTYRKWASGLAECWRYSQHTGVQLNTAWASPIYYYSTPIQENLPSTLFAGTGGSVTSCQCTVDIASGQSGADCWVSAATGYPLSTTKTCGVYLLRVNSATGAKVINLYWLVQGRWKA